MRLFWSRGYEATSISDLTQAMEITPPSLYAAFGDKKRLFLEAVERYEQETGCFAASSISTARSNGTRRLDRTRVPFWPGTSALACRLGIEQASLLPAFHAQCQSRVRASSVLNLLLSATGLQFVK
jgi:TetR/AcrR family transcriptional regulator, copper-responsive repressor